MVERDPGTARGERMGLMPAHFNLVMSSSQIVYLESVRDGDEEADNEDPSLAHTCISLKIGNH